MSKRNSFSENTATLKNIAARRENLAINRAKLNRIVLSAQKSCLTFRSIIAPSLCHPPRIFRNHSRTLSRKIYSKPENIGEESCCGDGGGGIEFPAVRSIIRKTVCAPTSIYCQLVVVVVVLYYFEGKVKACNYHLCEGGGRCSNFI